jgi:hypothetical protein
MSGDNACPCFGCQCEPNQVTKDAIEEARNRRIEMTHDELLEEIDFLPLDGLLAWMQPALRAVVELHSPSNTGGCGDGECCGEFDEQDHCIICREDYPCPTIQAIEKELG